MLPQCLEVRKVLEEVELHSITGKWCCTDQPKTACSGVSLGSDEQPYAHVLLIIINDLICDICLIISSTMTFSVTNESESDVNI